MVGRVEKPREDWLRALGSSGVSPSRQGVAARRTGWIGCPDRRSFRWGRFHGGTCPPETGESPTDVRAAGRASAPGGRSAGSGTFALHRAAGRPRPIIQAIDAARSQIRLGICNLSDPQIGAALAASVARGVNVKVIADQADYTQKPLERAELATLSSQGVSVHLSNSVFPQSFEKELVIDQRQVLIMTMCLIPTTFIDSRDYGLVLRLFTLMLKHCTYWVRFFGGLRVPPLYSKI